MWSIRNNILCMWYKFAAKILNMSLFVLCAKMNAECGIDYWYLVKIPTGNAINVSALDEAENNKLLHVYNGFLSPSLPFSQFLFIYFHLYIFNYIKHSPNASFCNLGAKRCNHGARNCNLTSTCNASQRPWPCPNKTWPWRPIDATISQCKCSEKDRGRGGEGERLDLNWFSRILGFRSHRVHQLRRSVRAQSRYRTLCHVSHCHLLSFDPSRKSRAHIAYNCAHCILRGLAAVTNSGAANTSFNRRRKVLWEYDKVILQHVYNISLGTLFFINDKDTNARWYDNKDINYLYDTGESEGHTITF